MKNMSARTPLRCLIVGAASAALILGTSACSSSAPDGEAAPAAPAADFPTTGTGELNLFNTTNYINPDTLALFTAETGIKVNLDTFSSAEEMVAKVKTGAATYDVINMSDYVAEDLIESGQILEIDAMTWPNGGNIETAFVEAYFDEGRKYSTPYTVIYNGIGYDSDTVGEAVDSWEKYFSVPEGSAGNIGLHDRQTYVIDAALFAVGSTPCTDDGKAYQQALDLLNEFKPAVKVISSDGTIDRLAGGETVLSTMWDGSFARALAQKPSLKYALPSDGFSYYTNNLAILSNAQNVDNAKIFMNWMLDPANAATNANWVKYSVPIKGIGEELAKLDDGGAAVMQPTAEEFERGVAQVPCSVEVQEQYDKLWTKFKG